MIRRAKREGGFTLVELLVVMLILGLLAAIAVPAFLSQRAKADDAEAKAQARAAQVAAETLASDGNGRYTGISAEALVGIEPALTPAEDRLSADPAADGAGYEITVTAKGTGNTFTVKRDGYGRLTYPCTEDGKAGCPDTGTWGG